MIDRGLDRLATLVIGRPKQVALFSLLLVAAAGVYGGNVAQHLAPGGYEVGGSESTRALAVLADDFDAGPANLVLLLDSGISGGVDEQTSLDAAATIESELAQFSEVRDITSYWSTGASQLRSGDGSQAIVTARVVGTENEIYHRVEEVRERFEGPGASVRPLAVTVGGSAISNLEIVEESERDLLRAELIAIPITTIIMLIVFRSVIAALLPLVVSAVAVFGTAAMLKGLTEFTPVSIFALNLTTALGLGMGVDFSLFTISRWREERAKGAEPDDALRITMTKAGRSILFSGLTTAATIAALIVYDYPLLQALAVAGFAVVLLAGFGALVALPAVIALLGDRVDKFQLRRPKAAEVEDGRWYGLARWVMCHPGMVIVGTVAILLLAGSPFLRAQFGIPDDRILPSTSHGRYVADELRSNFDALPFGVMAAVGSDVDGADTIDRYATNVSSVAGVAQVEAATGVYVDGVRIADSVLPARFTNENGTWLSIVPLVEPISPAAETMVNEIRALPDGSSFLLGGESARLVDNKAEIGSKLIWVVVWVFVVVALLLYASFRSVIMPVKAVLLNLLSLTAAFGALVWIFQDGRLTGLLDFTSTGMVDTQTPVLIFCIAFGLSMDYEVFLLSRIKEEWDRTGDSDHSVAVGLQQTGGIITAAAVLMAVVFLSFASGRVTIIQMVGIGLALSIVADAALVRSLLVPAFMKVAGEWNWWSPFRRRSNTAEPSAIPEAELVV